MAMDHATQIQTLRRVAMDRGTTPEHRETLLERIAYLTALHGEVPVEAPTQAPRQVKVGEHEEAFTGTYRYEYMRVYSAAAAAMGCTVLRVTIGRTEYARIVGAVDVLEQAKTVASFAVDIAKAALTVWAKEEKPDWDFFGYSSAGRTKLRKGFLLGFGGIVALRIQSGVQQAEKQATTATPGTALVRASAKDAVNRYMAETYPRLTTSRKRTVDRYAYGAGMSAASRVSIGGASLGTSEKKAVTR